MAAGQSGQKGKNMKEYIERIIKMKKEAIEKLVINPNMENAGKVRWYNGEIYGADVVLAYLQDEVKAETAAEIEECRQMIRNA